MPARDYSAYLALLVTLCAPAAALALDLDASVFRNRERGIKIEVPEGWTLYRQVGFPGMLAIMYHGDGVTSISLTAAPLASAGLEAQVKDDVKGLRALRLEVQSIKPVTLEGRSIWRVESQTRGGDKALRQAYLKHAGHVMILTLSCPREQLQARAFDLAQVIGTLELRQPPSEGSEAASSPTVPALPGPALQEDGAASPGDNGQADQPGAEVFEQPSSSRAGPPPTQSSDRPRPLPGAHDAELEDRPSSPSSRPARPAPADPAPGSPPR